LKDALVKQTERGCCRSKRNENSFECSKNGNLLWMCIWWMEEMSGLMTSAGAIAATQDIELQREIFIPFSKSI
jgi:hypothetical protein